MTYARFAVAGCAILTATMLAGCSGSSPSAETSTPPQSAPSVAAAASAPAAPATASSASLPGDNAETARYKIAIGYPTLTAAEAPLMQALRESSVAAKREFMQALPDPQQLPQFADRQLQLLINYTMVARTPAFVSVREKGMADTGGAHPLPIDASFVYDNQAQRMISLSDLFTDAAQARQRFSELARKSLASKLLTDVPQATPEIRKQWLGNMHKMIDEGTQPSVENFSEFTIDAGTEGKSTGITLLFSPYQVAPYVYGGQSVEVPMKVFADLLKPRYRDAFDGG